MRIRTEHAATTRTRDDIQADLARAEARLAGIDRSRAAIQDRVAALRVELELTEGTGAAPATRETLPPSGDIGAARLTSGAVPADWEPLGREGARSPNTPSEKLALFASLFRGRPDVFPTRFVSRKTGRAGYALACDNKFRPGVCGLGAGVKCGDCGHQAFLPVSERALLDHLQGRHVMGVYPLQTDDTCWLLAVDFDKRSWREDVAAFRETCRLASVPVAIERSRSGEGAHAWFFFDSPVSAHVARRMGCALLTDTMTRRHELDFASYDRLFPNQDTVPRGGFGNLIALPLQHEARRQGNSVFVDERFEPHPDQWNFLARIARIAPGRVDDLAREASRAGRVLGVRFADSFGDDSDGASAPWMREPPRIPRIAAPLPSRIQAVLAQQLFVAKGGLPSALLSQIKRLAAFQNPEFYKRQKMRLSTALTPRVIACAEEGADVVALPRGCVPELEALLAEHDVVLEIDDRRHTGEALDLAFRGELTPLQQEASSALLAHETGVFVAPPGIGKTVLGTYLVARRACSTLVLVHRAPLLEQWVAQLAMFLGISDKEIGRIGGGRRKPNGRLDVAMIQSLVRKGQVDERVAQYGHVIVDECHHLPAVSFERVLAEAHARYVLGLTATPQRRDGHHPITEMQLGPVRYRVDPQGQAVARPFEHRLIVRETSFRLPAETPDGQDLPIQEIYQKLVLDPERNDLILDDILAAIEEGRSPIVLTERRDHLDSLADRLRSAVRHLVVLRGGMKRSERREADAQLAQIPDTAERLVLAIGRYAGEGFDDARLDTLFLTMPVSWKGTLVQYSGRLHRRHPAKREVRIYDYVDRNVPMLLRMFGKRLPTYRAIGYARGEAPLGFAEPSREPTVVYDTDALRHFENDP